MTIGASCRIGASCQIGAYVLIHPEVAIGGEVRIDARAEIGKRPMKAARSTLRLPLDLPPATIGRGVKIGSGAVIYRGARVGDDVMIADGATVREGVVIGEGTIVGRGVTIEQECRIGRSCKIESNAYVTAFSTIEDFCFIAPMVAFSNDRYLGRTQRRLSAFQGPTLRRGARIGVNATILPGIEIGEDALVAAGSVVTKNVPSRTVVIGVPARVRRPVAEEELLENQSKGAKA